MSSQCSNMADKDCSEEKPLKAAVGQPRSSSRWTFWLLYSTAVCVLGSSLQFGYNTTCINAPEEDIKKSLKMTLTQWSTAVAIFAVGGMIGSLLSPFLANIIGRKRTLLLNNLPTIIAAVLMFSSFYAKSPWPLILGRFIIGLSCGINTAVVPMYLSEIAPIPLRGALGTLNQLGIVTGLLLGFVLGLTQVLGTATGWLYIVGFSVFPAVLQLLTLFPCPRSPRYLLLKLNEEAEAVQALRVLRDTQDVSADIEEMRIEQESELQEARVSIVKLFTSKDLQMPLLISVVLQLSQQLSGINAVFYYSTKVFTEAGLSADHSREATCGIGAISIVMTLVVIRLVEVVGRRMLMLIGIGGMFVFYAVMTMAFCLQTVWSGMNYIAVVGTLMLVVFFQLGPGPIPWFITAELFSQGPRPAAVSVANTVNWLANFLVGISFPAMQHALHPFTFLVFLGLVALFWIFTYFYVPETKGKSIEEITARFRHRRGYSGIGRGNSEADAPVVEQSKF